MEYQWEISIPQGDAQLEPKSKRKRSAAADHLRSQE